MCHLRILQFACACNIQRLLPCSHPLSKKKSLSKQSKTKSPLFQADQSLLLTEPSAYHARICPFFHVSNLSANKAVYPCPRGHAHTDRVAFLLQNGHYDILGVSHGRIDDWEAVKHIPGEGFVRERKRENWDAAWWVGASEGRPYSLGNEIGREKSIAGEEGKKLERVQPRVRAALKWVEHKQPELVELVRWAHGETRGWRLWEWIFTKDGEKGPRRVSRSFEELLTERVIYGRRRSDGNQMRSEG